MKGSSTGTLCIAAVGSTGWAGVPEQVVIKDIAAGPHGKSGHRVLNSFQLLKTMVYFPLLVLKGIYHCWKCVFVFYIYILCFSGGLSKWKAWQSFDTETSEPFLAPKSPRHRCDPFGLTFWTAVRTSWRSVAAVPAENVEADQMQQSF